MDRSRWVIAVLALAAAASFAVFLYTASYDGWPTPQRHGEMLLVSAVLFILLIILSVVVAAIMLKSRPQKVRTGYVMPVERGDDEDKEIKGKMPGETANDHRKETRDEQK